MPPRHRCARNWAFRHRRARPGQRPFPRRSPCRGLPPRPRRPRRLPNGSFTITLVDGQVWEQIAEDEIYHRARWRKPASEMAVTITPDAMHTFVMTVSGENYMYKVHRTR